ncbi:MAG: hypothetical protein AAB803_00165 [Patescibacteria group bacterium]
MTATAHALVAGAIASKFADPLTASGLSLISHYIMDSIPHWDFGTNWRLRPKTVTGTLAIGETLFGIALAFWLFSKSAPALTLAACIFASLLPDWIETPWYIFFASAKKKEPSGRAGFVEKLSYRIYKIQNDFHAKAQLPFGLITQVVTVGFFLYLLK